MKIRVHEISDTPEEVEFEQDTAELNPTLQYGENRDYQCRGPVRVGLTHYRAGRDLFFDGTIESAIAGRCARCLEDFEFAVSTDFHFIVAPRDETGDDDSEDVEVSVYDGDQIDLAPLVSERIILSLPTMPLCRGNCRGLCPRCGTNLNENQCHCQANEGDPRMAVFKTLRVDRH